MITIDDYYETPELLEMGEEFTKFFGGRFFGSVPDGRLAYTQKNGGGSYLSPHDETVSTVFHMLQESMKREQDLIVESWPRITYKPDCVY